MKPNKKYAVTGGIGSGKSAVCLLLRQRGFPVISCDEISRELWKEDGYRRTLAELFPNCTAGGEIEKERLSALVFRDRAALARLNAYTHGEIMRRLCAQAESFPLCFCEVPLLFEGGFARLFDGVLVVLRDREVRIDALNERSGMSREESLARMANQFDYENGIPENCIAIENDGSLTDLSARLNEALRQLGIHEN